MINRIAIMGTGSLGTILGAYISKHRQIDLIDANKAHVEKLNKDGAHITGNVEFSVPVKAITPDEMEGAYDLIIYMAKQTVNDVCLPKIVAHLKKDGIIVTCQNGLPEPAVCEYWPEKQVLGAPTSWGATFLGPGTSALTSKLAEMPYGFTLGTVTGEENERLNEVKEILELMCPVHVSSNLMGERWCKVLMNATQSGLSTVGGCTFGEVLDDDIAIKAVVHIGNEAIRVCAATGVTMEPLGSIDFSRLFDIDMNDEAALAACDEVWRSAMKPHRLLEASMLQDIRNGRKCEIFAINGVISKFGEKNGVKTPVCDQVVSIVSRIENGILPLSKENFQLITFHS